ncbi:hypothetical protein [Streptomyces sp. CFMR 7]|uniref:hypothetical protein n=1 Tax=Streptomyces sp. CFMR 7 TaxID=1649184 RepID=UPI0011AA7880|nr:hypothetical protein [Streptomyces sp. CFMR 7]
MSARLAPAAEHRDGEASEDANAATRPWGALALKWMKSRDRQARRVPDVMKRGGGAANVRRMIAEAERDVTRDDYLRVLRPELVAAAAHLERRISVDGTLLRHLENLRADASEEQDPVAVRQLSRAASRLGDAVETLAALQTDVIGAAPRWREAQKPKGPFRVSRGRRTPPCRARRCHRNGHRPAHVRGIFGHPPAALGCAA